MWAPRRNFEQNQKSLHEPLSINPPEVLMQGFSIFLKIVPKSLNLLFFFTDFCKFFNSASMIPCHYRPILTNSNIVLLTRYYRHHSFFQAVICHIKYYLNREHFFTLEKAFYKTSTSKLYFRSIAMFCDGVYIV